MRGIRPGDIIPQSEQTMGSRAKTLCEWKKEWFRERFTEFRAIVSRPRFACRKCGRAAKEEQWLCKPMTLRRLAGARPKDK